MVIEEEIEPNFPLPADEPDVDDEEEEETEENLTVVHQHNTPVPPQIEWVLTNTNYKIEIRIWNAEDEKVKEWAFEMFDKSLKAVKGRSF